MESLYIQAGELTPEIRFSPSDNQFYIRGVSAPENVRDLYAPVLEWLDTFVSSSNPSSQSYTTEKPFKLQVDLQYFNSSSAKFLFDIFSKLKELPSRSVIIEWYYDSEDVDMMDAGMDFASLVGMYFSYKEKKER